MRRGDALLPWAGLAALLLAWWGASAHGLIDPRSLPGPFQLVRSVAETLTPQRVLQDVAASLLRVVLGVLIGSGLGVLLGMLAGWYRGLGVLVSAPVELLRPVPPLAWIPLAIVWFGIGLNSKLFIIALAAFFPVYTSTLAGLRGIDPGIIRAAQLLGVRGRRMLLNVVVPMALPDIATGLRLAWSYGFGAMVAAEIIGANTGLGYLIMRGRELGLVSVILFGIVLIAALNLLVDALFTRYVMRRFLRWNG